MCRSLQVHHTELTDQPGSLWSWPSGQHVGWHDHPATLGAHEVADKVVREFVARLGHRDVVPRATDTFGVQRVAATVLRRVLRTVNCDR
jgi:hypothetical protein